MGTPQWREETKGNVTYRVHADGRVAVYATEFGNPSLWVAVAWSADPRDLDNRKALPLGSLCRGASRAELDAALDRWARGDG